MVWVLFKCTRWLAGGEYESACDLGYACHCAHVHIGPAASRLQFTKGEIRGIDTRFRHHPG